MRAGFYRLYAVAGIAALVIALLLLANTTREVSRLNGTIALQTADTQQVLRQVESLQEQDRGILQQVSATATDARARQVASDLSLTAQLDQLRRQAQCATLAADRAAVGRCFGVAIKPPALAAPAPAPAPTPVTSTASPAPAPLLPPLLQPLLPSSRGRGHSLFDLVADLLSCLLG